MNKFFAVFFAVAMCAVTLGFSGCDKANNNTVVKQFIIENMYEHYQGFYDGWVYTYFDRAIWRTLPNGTNREKVKDGNMYNAVLNDGWIYYIDEIYEHIPEDHPPLGEGSNLCRMRPDRSENMELANDVFEFQIQGDNIYFRADYEIFVMKNDGSEKRKLLDNCSAYLVSGGYLFVTLGGIGGGAAQYATKLGIYDADGVKVLIQSDVTIYRPYFTDEGYIYYYVGDAVNGVQIHRMKFDATDKKVIVKHEGYGLLDNVLLRDGYIYYVRGAEMFRIRTDGTKRETIRPNLAYSGYFQIHGNEIIYEENRAPTRSLYKMDLNGKNNKIIYQWTNTSVYYQGYFVHNGIIYVAILQR